MRVQTSLGGEGGAAATATAVVGAGVSRSADCRRGAGAARDDRDAEVAGAAVLFGEGSVTAPFASKSAGASIATLALSVTGSLDGCSDARWGSLGS